MVVSVCWCYYMHIISFTMCIGARIWTHGSKWNGSAAKWHGTARLSLAWCLVGWTHVRISGGRMWAISSDSDMNVNWRGQVISSFLFFFITDAKYSNAQRNIYYLIYLREQIFKTDSALGCSFVVTHF